MAAKISASTSSPSWLRWLLPVLALDCWILLDSTSGTSMMVDAFIVSRTVPSNIRTIQLLTGSRLYATISREDLKEQLTEYLQKRKELDADKLAEQEKGKVIGGTKGNKILDYVSGAPTKERVIEQAPNVFDYDELTKYGYGKLVTPIMDMGGRTFVYDLMGMDPPPVVLRPKPKSAPKLEIDRTGANDPARYSGLKMGQVLDDNAMAEALQQAQEKSKKGEALRPKLQEEEFEKPFADKRNVGPKQTPDWTPEKLDEAGRARGRAESWVRRAKEGEFVKDPYESLDLSFDLRMYCIFAAFGVSFAFGRSTPTLLHDFLSVDAGLQDIFQIPALALVAASLGSSIVCGVLFAPPKNRSALIWTIKGFMGGPLAILQLRGLDTLLTQGETDALKRKQ